ncbi:MAG: hypothetical protein AABX19_02400 [Nanoarchaeota archaeon]
MDKQELTKNKLDLEYHSESQKMNAILVLITTGILGFVGSFIWLLNKDYFVYGRILTFFILIISYISYRKVCRRMKSILFRIENL